MLLVPFPALVEQQLPEWVHAMLRRLAAEIEEGCFLKTEEVVAGHAFL